MDLSHYTPGLGKPPAPRQRTPPCLQAAGPPRPRPAPAVGCSRPRVSVRIGIAQEMCRNHPGSPAQLLSQNLYAPQLPPLL